MTRFLASIPSPPQGVWHIHIPVLDVSLPIRAYALCIIAGIIVALVIGDRRWVARGGEQGVIYDIALLAVPFGLVGGRLYHVMTDWPKYFGPDGAGFLAALRIWDGGLGIWGAVALGGVGAWIGCRLQGIPLPAFGDAIAPGIVLAQAIGRLGNYFNQELYGGPTSLPWGLEIYERRDSSGAINMMEGVSTGQLAEPPVHPTFLYELLWNVLVFVVLIYVDRRFKIGHGRLFALYVALYCVGRFLIELRALGLRADEATLISGIRINSFTSTFVFIGAVVYIVLAPKGREDPKTLAGKPREPTTEEPKAKKSEKPKEALEGKDSELVEWTKELVGAAATSGLVAGVAVAAKEDEDESADESAVETEEHPEEPAGEPASADAEVGDVEAAEKSDDEDESAETEEPEESVEESESADAAEPSGESEQPVDIADEVVDEEPSEGESEVSDVKVDEPEGDSADADEPATQTEEQSDEPSKDSPPSAEADEAEGDPSEAEATDEATETVKVDEQPAEAVEEPVQDSQSQPQRRRFARLRSRFR